MFGIIHVDREKICLILIYLVYSISDGKGLRWKRLTLGPSILNPVGTSGSAILPKLVCSEDIIPDHPFGTPIRHIHEFYKIVQITSRHFTRTSPRCHIDRPSERFIILTVGMFFELERRNWKSGESPIDASYDSLDLQDSVQEPSTPHIKGVWQISLFH
jgi:hypothetical protein